jgi:hypothetical protein
VLKRLSEVVKRDDCWFSERPFAKPKTDAREDKKSLSKSISNGLKKVQRENEKSRGQDFVAACCRSEEGKVSGREREGII